MEKDSISGLPKRLKQLTQILLRPHVLLLIFLAIVIVKGIYPDEFHYFGDEMRHGVTGIFFRDFFVDMPLQAPVRYAYEYYAKYPALGVPHWPPFYYIVEGFFFLLFGISVVTSRLTTLAFALVGAYCWYRIAEREGPRYRALLSTFVFALLPYVLLYERATMLEIPQVAMCLLTIFFWLRFLDTDRRAFLWATSAAGAVAMLTSQKSAFLVFLLVPHFLIERRFRLLLRWDFWLALIAGMAVVIPWYVLTFGNLALSYERATGDAMHFLRSSRHLTFYLEMVPRQLGWPLTLLAGAGFGLALFTKPWKSRLFLLWIICTYACYTVVQEKDLRHTMILVPPLVYFAIQALETLFVRPPWSAFACTVLAVAVLIQGWMFDRPRMTGIKPVAEYVLSLPESDLIYYQGTLNGDFIFYIRKLDPQKRHMVAREKQVVATRIVPGYGTRVVLRTPEEIIDLFRTWGIRYAVVESVDYVEDLAVVHKALASGQFEQLRTFELWSNRREDFRRKILVYRFKGELQRSKEPVSIPMMTLRDDIKADLNRLVGKPWPN